MPFLPLPLRQRLRDWRGSLAFMLVMASAVAIAGAWLALARPLLTSVPFSGADRLIALASLKNGQRGGLTWTSLEELRGGNIEEVAGFAPRTWGFQSERHGHVEVVLSLQVTERFFDVFQLPARIERDSVWLSDDAWRRLLGGARNVAGRSVWINAEPYRIAGVLPADFQMPTRAGRPDIYIPLNRAEYWGPRGAGNLDGIARMRPDATRAQVQAQLDAQNRDGMRYVTSDLAAMLLGDRVPVLRWLLAAVALFLLVAMLNASGIWLAQWLKHQRDAQIQSWLGATRTRIVQGQLAQVLYLGVGASLLGLAGADLILRCARLSPALNGELTRYELWDRAGLRWESATLLVLIAIVASVISGLLPVTGAGSRARRMRIGLAVAQLTLTGALAFMGILVFRNIQGLLNADRGFRTEQILISGIGIPEAKYNTDEKMIRFHQQAIAELRTIPGVLEAAGGMSMPVSPARTRFLLDNETAARDRQPMARLGVASPELLPLLGIPLQRGRGFGAADSWSSQRIALVNQKFADTYLAGQDPIGHKLRVSFYNGFAMKPYAEHVIVGVTGNTLNRDLASETEPQILLTSNQIALEGFHYFLRSTLPAEALRTAVRQAIWRVDPELQSVSLNPLAAQIERSLVSRSTIAWVLGGFAWLAWFVVTAGLASSLTATFVEMTRELAIRSALGASPVRVAFEAVRWAALAIATSWVLSFPLCVWISARLDLGGPALEWDFGSWMLTSLALAAVGLVSSISPARKAISIELTRALRQQ